MNECIAWGQYPKIDAKIFKIFLDILLFSSTHITWIDEWMDGWMDGWMDEWMDGSMDRWMGEWMNEWMDFVNFTVKESIDLKIFISYWQIK